MASFSSNQARFYDVTNEAGIVSTEIVSQDATPDENTAFTGKGVVRDTQWSYLQKFNGLVSFSVESDKKAVCFSEKF